MSENIWTEAILKNPQFENVLRKKRDEYETRLVGQKNLITRWALDSKIKLIDLLIETGRVEFEKAKELCIEDPQWAQEFKEGACEAEIKLRFRNLVWNVIANYNRDGGIHYQQSDDSASAKLQPDTPKAPEKPAGFWTRFFGRKSV